MSHLQCLHSVMSRPGKFSARDKERFPKRYIHAVPEANIVEQNSDEPTPKSLVFKLSFIGLAAAVFVFQLDATCLGIALPTIAGELNGQTLQSFWANMSYYLCGLVMQPLWASISDTFGRKPLLYICMAFFAVGSIIFALAKNMNMIIVGRVLQGFGGGGIDVLAEIILADMTTLQERSLYLGLMAIPMAIGNILGPSIGALFSTYASWRWIGWFNLPFLGFALPLLIFFLRLRPVQLDESFTKNLNRLDWIGMIFLILATTIFVIPFSWAGSLYPWRSWQTLLPMMLGVALLIIFTIYEAKPAVPVIPHRLFYSKTFNMSLAGSFIHGMILVSLLNYLPLLYQSVGLETSTGSAVSLLPAVITSVAVSAGLMMTVGAVGGYIWLIRVSWVAVTVGSGLLALFNLGPSSSMRISLPILWGIGVAGLRLLLLPMQASVKNIDDTGLAIAQQQAFRMFGGLVGLTIGSTIFNSVFSASISSIELPAGPLTALANANDAIAFIPELRLLGFGGLGLITSLIMKDLDLNKRNLGQQRFEE
uniref:Putative transporter C3H1.06c n=1 Tax=Talaromyces marneffei PM1 TaxID=1077442 RepID=A0A093VET8_TALMA